jgi:hypothetical protein
MLPENLFEGMFQRREFLPHRLPDNGRVDVELSEDLYTFDERFLRSLRRRPLCLTPPSLAAFPPYSVGGPLGSTSGVLPKRKMADPLDIHRDRPPLCAAGGGGILRYL